ncbi:MAG: hypothetical protein JXO51_07480 [Candidatus Aminicenantes bacterium]|nr:hypothetical protein [Candidatus Aminicenantes bacterium]
MPKTGYKKPLPRSFMLRVRLTEEERALLEKARKKSKYPDLSKWVRDVVLREAKEGRET